MDLRSLALALTLPVAAIVAADRYPQLVQGVQEVLRGLLALVS